jgi:hypothetical protein
MAKKLTESQVLERMHAARADAFKNTDLDRARASREGLLDLIKRYPDVAQTHGVEVMPIHECGDPPSLKLGDPGYVSRIK